MGLERFEWKRFDTEDPDPIIEHMSWFGWRVHSIRNRERVLRAKHSGSTVNMSTSGGSLGSYSGTTTLEREYWTELTMVREPTDPHYRQLVELERVWHSQGPGHRIVRPPSDRKSRLGIFIAWTFAMMFPMAMLAYLLLPLPFYQKFVETSGALTKASAFLVASALAALPATIRAKTHPAFSGDPPLTDEEKREWNRKGAEHTKKRYAALERAQELTGTRK
ncbi:MAG: hypothetical protein AABY18_04675 [Candidatus Thermoplasmatota archaeon]